MHDCPRCINGDMFYDAQSHEWWCLNCGHHNYGNGTKLLSLATKLTEVKAEPVRNNGGTKPARVELKVSPTSRQTSETLSLDEEIAQLRRKLRSYENQKKLLLNLLRDGEITRDNMLSELEQLQKGRDEEEKELSRLCQIRDSWRGVLKIK